ncbi:hypothetical protein [Candidatus Vidania fulgoroideorum]
MIFDKLKTKIINKKKINSNLFKFKIGPINIGFGTLIGCFLRRMLFLTKGYSIKKIILQSSYSEFLYIKGIKEDLSDFVLNIKKLVLKLKNINELEIFIKKKGPCIIKGEDFIKNECKVYNPELEILSINSNVLFSFSVIVNKGVGYTKYKNSSIINEINIDAYYCPILKVFYKIKKKKDYENLFLFIKTNGSVNHEKTLKKAFFLLKNSLNIK